MRFEIEAGSTAWFPGDGEIAEVLLGDEPALGLGRLSWTSAGAFHVKRAEKRTPTPARSLRARNLPIDN
jgi:hypothetical protein